MPTTDSPDTSTTDAVLELGIVSGVPLSVSAEVLAAGLDTWVLSTAVSADQIGQALHSMQGETAGTVTATVKAGLYRSLGMVTERDRRESIPATYGLEELNRLAISAEIEEMLSVISP